MNAPLIIAALEGTMYTSKMSVDKLKELNRRAMMAGVAGGVPSTRFDSASRELDYRKIKSQFRKRGKDARKAAAATEPEFAQVEAFLAEGLNDAIRDVAQSMGTGVPMLAALRDIWPHRQWLDGKALEIVTAGFQDYLATTGTDARTLVRQLGGTDKDIPGAVAPERPRPAATPPPLPV